jgi:IS4 transposase
LKTKKSAKDYPVYLRRIKYYDKENDLLLVFLTNNLEVSALTIALLYKQRWQVELFFKWIKQHLKIQVFWGYSANAVKTQVWIAICSYLIVAYIKKQLNIDLTLYEMLQILSVSIFSKETISELFTNLSKNIKNNMSYNQLNLFNL